MSGPAAKVRSSNEVREAFLQYFEKHGHTRVASSSLVPGNDPTLLFTNAGMVQFKDVFLGDEQRDYARATSSQRCVRAGGKHNDLENVGYTARHHTFFEMLGNFSFGDYFKAAAIPFGWNFLTRELGIAEEKLWVTIYEEDDEAFDIWHKQVGLPIERIIRIGDNKGGRYASDNFWAMGDTGPCGPCSEIFYDHGAHIEGGLPGTPEEDGDRFIEIWNIVFMQFNRSADGQMQPLPKPSVDTGMGLERIAAVMQGVHSNYEIDLFRNLLAAAAKLLGIKDEGQGSLRVIADHIRSCAFLVVDGVLPSNEGRGYVLRRIIRRAIRHGNKLGASQLFFHKLVAPLVAEMGQAYPELAERQAQVEAALKTEEEQFAQTLEQGMRILEQAIANLGGKKIPGDVAFKLYDTYGFPLDLTADIARERGLQIDNAGYQQAMNRQREQARSAGKFKTAALGKLDVAASGATTNTAFSGYDKLSDSVQVEAIFVDGQAASALSSGEDGVLVLASTPFYAESGGQVGDAGIIRCESGIFEVRDTQKQGETFLHIGVMQSGSIKQGDSVHAEVDEPRRRAIALNHSATHLLHAALRVVLGDHVAQKGSLVDDQRLRFDFSHNAPLSAAELEQVTRIVNQQVQGNSEVNVQLTDMASAKAAGAMALFGEKYGDQVRVLAMGDERFSVELCGGTHVERTGDIGLFSIVAETGIASGVRRVEAITGANALDNLQTKEQTLREAAEALRTAPDKLVDKIAQLQQSYKTLEKECQRLNQKLNASQGADLAGGAEAVAGAQLLVQELPDADARSLRDTVDQLKQKLGSSVVVLAATGGEKIALVAGVSDDLTAKVKAGDLIKSLAADVGGKGGGKPQFAQGGGVDKNALAAALEATRERARAALVN
ncbi:MAG: alanine--tRNA ligase [Pseudomonadales bacterium]|nr:MAG: alanine--tRNA ligase [Pseudomonadales bacterium]